MLKLIKKLNLREVILIAISIGLIVVQVWLDLKLPGYMSNITSLIQNGITEISEILKVGFKMILCALGSLGSAVVVGYCTANTGASFSKRLRELLFKKVGDFSMEEIKNFSTSSLITRTTNDITQVQMLIVMGFQLIVKAPIMSIWALKKIANKGMEFSIVTAIGVGSVVLLIVILLLLVMPKFKKMQKLIDNLNDVSRENLTGIRVVRAFNAEDYQKKKFNKSNKELTNTNLFTQRCISLLSPYITLVMSGISLSIYWIGAALINGADMMNKIEIFSNMVVFSSYAIQVIISFMFLVIVFMHYPRASVAAKRINEVLETKTKIKDGFNKGKSDLRGAVEFKNVSFKYPDADEYMLKNISFKANAGETIAFIGSTGSGKSTLVNLIPRFYDATEGEILVDGINIKDYKLSDLNNKLGYISQKAALFKDTIYNNIKYGVSNKKITEKDIRNALKVSMSSFVDDLEDGYKSNIAQSGTNLSGGQKQRLSIARAIARNPEIYIFDDSFSALDFKTDFELRKELKKFSKTTTIIIVAQRIGTIINADKIVVLNNGICEAIGTHKELLQSSKTYKEIAQSQLSKEDLQNGQ